MQVKFTNADDGKTMWLNSDRILGLSPSGGEDSTETQVIFSLQFVVRVKGNHADVAECLNVSEQ